MDDEGAREFNRLIQEHGLNPREALAVTDGKWQLDDILRAKEARVQAARLARKPKVEWPLPAVAWDLGSTRWHLSMDDHDPESFAEAFPDAEVVWVDMAQLQGKLAEGSRRIKNPFHSTYKHKTARLVVHLEGGGQVSPPMIVWADGKLHIAGGNNRLGWAQHVGQTDLPILIRASDRLAIGRLVDLR